MSDRSAEVHDTQPIRAFAQVLSAWAGSARERAHRAEVELDETITWVRQRADYWAAQVDHLTGVTLELQRELAVCLSQPEVAWCGEIENRLMEVTQQLRAAEESLERATFWSTRLQHQASDWGATRSRLSRTLADDVPDATRLLQEKMDIIEAYATQHISDDRSGAVEPLRTAPTRPQRARALPLPLPIAPIADRPAGDSGG